MVHDGEHPGDSGRRFEVFAHERRGINWPALIFYAGYLAALTVLAWWLFSLLTGCATTQTRAATPAGCENSLIFARTDPTALNALGLIAVSELAHFYPAARPYLVGAFEGLDALLEDGKITYVEFAQAAVQRVAWVNQYFGTRLLVYTEILSIFDRPVPIDPCDADLVRGHLKKQLAYMGVTS